ncbi:MAG: DUF5696 domain-containing protein [Candidatus Omnitrophota bacterium]
MEKIVTGQGKIKVVLDPTEKGALEVTEITSGMPWNGCDSFLQLNAWDMALFRSRKFEGLVRGIRLKEKKDESLITFQYQFPEAGIGCQVHLKITENYLEIFIPFNHLKEEKDWSYRLMSLEVMPNFGGQPVGSEGFLFMPVSGEGAICRFNRMCPASGLVSASAEQTRWEDLTLLPVFAVITKKTTLLGIVVSGDYDADIQYRVGWGDRKIHSAHTVFNYRYRKTDGMDNSDRVVRYYFLDCSPENALTEMARTVRKFLHEERGVLSLKERAKERPLVDYLRRAMKIKLQHRYANASNYKLDGTSPMVSGIPFDMAGGILKDLKRAGVERANVLSCGWNLGGVDARFPTRFPIEPSLGGEDGYRKMVKVGKTIGYRISVHDNFEDGYRSSPDWDDSLVRYDRDGEIIRGGGMGRRFKFKKLPGSDSGKIY